MTLDKHNEHETDFIGFLGEEAAEQVLPTQHVWRVLIVDDDTSVHQSIEFALRDVLILDRRLEFLNAHNAGEALEILRLERNIAAILLDVVMEHEHAGLALVKAIRNDLRITDTRIILHTGQPGFAPEISAIRDYDINDYRTKSELTRGHLYTCLASAVRAYRQIHAIERGRSQLRHIIQAGNALISEVDELAFVRGTLAQFASLLQCQAEGFVILGEAGAAYSQIQTIWASDAYSRYVGKSLEELDDKVVLECCCRVLEHEVIRWCQRGVALRIQAHDGHFLLLFVVSETLEPDLVDDSVIDTFVGHFASCLDNRALLERLHHDAYFDRLLGLPNRRNLTEQLDAAYQEHRHKPMVLSLIDIDHFGEINDALGQAFGDALLRALKERLRRSLPMQVSLARIAADVFAVLGEDSLVTPAILLPNFATPLAVLGEETMVSVSIGLTRLGDVETEGGAAALEAAFQALRQAKASQRGQLVWYTPELSRRTLERVTMLNGLRQSLRSTGLFVVFQPQVALGTGKLLGLEALVRWRTESGELIGPDRFIPVAEQSGLIRDIGYFVLREALSMLSFLHQHGVAGVRMAVNVSAVQFRQPDFLWRLKQVVAASGIDPHNLELEVTESVAMEHASYVHATLEAIRAQGIQLAIDDFGIGFSSLAQLKELKFDRLKIDRAFVQDLREGEIEASIAGVVIQLGQKLGIQVIAEGVETEEQAMLLQQLGCREAQGYLFGRPMTATDLLQWIQHRKAAEATDKG
ncbi:GGDEF/EAL domain-containing response regulator [Uliginosibacterium gangwonense]|uniref:GGDEF/EAL domain-containing response regulator n=1 Tax=Uliginosibacterium gangwonense TaxID=392736 RepID=UPI0003655ED5|nr:EAL domain-containing protein [Uliginosibacterium gangwonense]